MISEEVKIKASSEMNPALAALQQLNSNLERVLDTAKRVGQQDTFGKGLAQAGAFAGAILGVNSLLAVASTTMARFRAEYDNFLQRGEKAANAQVTFADAQRRFANILGDSSLQNASQRAIGIAGKTGIPPAQIGLAFVGALSGKGLTQKDEDAFSAVEEAAKFMPGPRSTAEDIGPLAQGIVTMRKRMPGLTSEQAMGFLRGAERASRSVEPTAFVTNVLPQIMQQYGGESDSLRRITAVATGIGQAAEDPTGRRTGTNFQNVLKQLRVNAKTFGGVPTGAPFVELEKFLFESDKGEKIRRKLLGPLYGTGELKDDDDIVSQMREAFTGTKVPLVGEAKTFMAFRDYLSGGSNYTRSAIEAAYGELSEPKSQAGIDALRAGRAEIEASPFQTAANAERSFAGTLDQLWLSNTVTGTQGSIRKKIPETLQASGASALVTDIFTKIFDAESAGAGTPSDVLRAGQRALGRGMARDYETISGGMGGQGVTVSRALTTGEQEVNSLLQKLSDQLGEQINLMKKNTPVQINLQDGGAPPVSAARGAGQ